jgi:glutamate--cysteine ligase
VAAQRAKLDNPELVPSAQLLRDMASSGQSFFGVAMGLAQQHQQHYARVQLPEPWRAAMVAEVARSQAAQAQLEAADNLSFSEYLASYYDQYQCCL